MSQKFINGVLQDMTAEEEAAFEAGRVVDLPALKSALKAVIDATAETERLKYITPGAGQALTYAQKADQAQAYLAAVAPVDADYPLLVAEIGITGASAAEVANVIKANFAAWQMIGAAIEATRLGTKQAIDAAAAELEARAAFEAAQWPAP
ncbi:hypothetical protein [Rhizobium sp. 12,4]|uniref:hypothetical protein n=1 Tax=Rhizobium sp. 12,4 TaxID=3405135 RepID=UPI003D333E93